MLECWRESADQRPNFESLARTLQDLESKHKVRGFFKIASTFIFIGRVDNWPTLLIADETPAYAWFALTIHCSWYQQCSLCSFI